MYLPPAFAWTDLPGIAAFARAHPFATVLHPAADPGEVAEAQHVPLLVDLVDGRLVLHGHVASGDPLWRASRALAVFHGPHAFVSAGWYDEPGTVPTWNYLAVHAHGALTRIADAGEARALMDRLAQVMEADASRRWLDRLDESMRSRLEGMIAWFRIDVARVEAKAKLSQNHAPPRRQKVVAALRARGGDDDRAIAEAMERTLSGGGPWA